MLSHAISGYLMLSLSRIKYKGASRTRREQVIAFKKLFGNLINQLINRAICRGACAPKNEVVGCFKNVQLNNEIT